MNSATHISRSDALRAALVLFFALSLATGAEAQWNWQSPIPQGNTLLKVQFIDSSLGWAVGEYGTALHTSNGGASWYEQEFARSDNLLDITMVSDSEGWTAGDNGVILHTTDSGDDWLEQNSGVASGLNTIVFLDTLNGWAAGDNEVILHTSNRGVNWSSQHTSIAPPASINALTFVSPTEGWAVGSGRTVFHTTDGGGLWTKQLVGIAPSNYLSVSFVTPTLGFIGGTGGVILRTDNGGLNWTAIASGVTGNLNEIVMQNTFVGWIAGDAGLLLKTINGGLSWSHIIVGGGENINGLSRTGGFLWGVGELGKIYSSTNSGVSWTDVDVGSRLSANWIDFPNDSVGIAVGQTGLIMRTTNGGASWTEQTSPAPTVSTYGVTCTDAAHGWAVGDNGTIIRTSDGSSWTVQSSPVSHTLFGVTFGDPTNGWIVGGEFTGFTGVILHSSDNGNSWAVQYSGVPNILYGVAFPSPSAGWVVGENGMILHTTNGGATWTPQTSGSSNALFWCTFADAQHGWAVGEQGTVLHTSNGGSVWSKQNSGASVNLYSIVNRGTSEAFAVGDGGTELHTTDAGAHWVSEYTRTQSSLYAITRAAGAVVWTSGDYGAVLADTIPRETEGTITGMVFNDLNNNSQLDFGEPGMEGWTIRLGGAKIDSVKTSGGGLFQFTGLLPGTYTLTQSDQPGWIRTFPASLPDSFTITAGALNFSGDFGEYADNSYGYGVSARWNLISLPLVVTNPRTSFLYPDATTAAYEFNGNYVVRDSLRPGPGYWIKYPTTQTVWILGTPITADTVAVQTGWNLIGSIQDSLPASAVTSDPPGIIVSSFFGYAGGYRAETTLGPGDGFWVQTTQPGVLYLKSGAAQSASSFKADVPADLSEIRMSDPDGNSETLFFGGDPGLDGTGALRPLPPLPPEGAFDARFSDGNSIARIRPENGEYRSATIAVRDASPRLTLSWKIRGNGAARYTLRDARTGAILRDALRGAASLTILDPGMRRFTITTGSGAGGSQVPHEFALMQNFPNPFNPTTAIRFDLPVRSNVRLTVYSVLGQEVASLAEGLLEAGEHIFTWAPTGASGLYFYRLEATDASGSGRRYVATRKMVLLR